MPIRRLNPWVHTHARRVGNLLFLSGVGPRQRGSKLIPGVTLDPSGNIESMILKCNVMLFSGMLN